MTYQEKRTYTTKRNVMADGLHAAARILAVLLILLAGTAGMRAQTDYSGVWYIASRGYNEADPTNNFYLCPTEGWAFYQATNDVTGTDNGQPFLTTYKCKNGTYDVTKAVWTIEKHPTKPNCYYIIQTLTGRYMISNGKISNGNARRMRVHLETVADPSSLDDKALFEITAHSDHLDIVPHSTEGRNGESEIYLVVNNNNKNQLTGESSKSDGPTGFKETGGIIGLYSHEDNAKFYLEKATIDPPAFTNNYTESNTVTITAEAGAIIYYTLDGTTPTTSTPTFGTTPVNVTIAHDSGVQTIKAIAQRPSDDFPTYVATYNLPQCAKPVITVSEGTVTIASADGTHVYYTTDDTEATLSSSTLYTSPFPLGGASIIRAIATKVGYAKSEEAYFADFKTVHSSSEMTNMRGYYLLADDFTSTASIGTSSEPFKGVIDGQMNILTGLSNPLVAYADGATIRNVMLSGVSISSSDESVGAIAGVAKGYSLIYNCGILPNDATFPEGTHPSVSTTGSCAGGIVGSLEDDSRVVNCFSYADVSSSGTGGTAAGIVGHNAYASTAAVTDGRYADLRTMVVNCMSYGNVSASTVCPVYGGMKISNAGASAINNYNYYSVGCEFSETFGGYNCSWPVKTEYLTRYEFIRSQLNSNRELCGWWVGAPSAPSSMTTAEVQAVPKDASLMAKWVLDPAVAPYPILKPFGRYPSPVNIDADASWRETANEWEGKKLGTLHVTVNAGAHGSGSTSLDIPITDMDTLRADYCYRKIQLPYYNAVFGNPDGTTWAEKYGGNYTDYAVTGWDITDPGDGTEVSLVEDWQDGYNFADRDCTDKDTKRTFAQGGYYYVPNGVTSITITAHWGKAIYLGNGDNFYDRVDFIKFRSTWKNPVAGDTWHTSMAATVIRGGMVGNQIPDTAEMLLNFRYLRPEEREELLQKLREVTGLEVTMDRTCPPVAVSTDAPELKILADTIEEIVGIRPGFDRMHGATDARWFASLNKPIAIIGVEGAGAHGKVEWVNPDSIEMMSRIVLAASRKYAGKR